MNISCCTECQIKSDPKPESIRLLQTPEEGRTVGCSPTRGHAGTHSSAHSTGGEAEHSSCASSARTRCLCWDPLSHPHGVPYHFSSPCPVAQPQVKPETFQASNHRSYSVNNHQAQSPQQSPAQATCWPRTAASRAVRFEPGPLLLTSAQNHSHLRHCRRFATVPPKNRSTFSSRAAVLCVTFFFPAEPLSSIGFSD